MSRITEDFHVTDNLKNLETAVEGFLFNDATRPTPERIREVIDQFRGVITCCVDDDAAEVLAKRFEERYGVTMAIGSQLRNAQHEPWLDVARSGITPYYWDRYRTLLRQQHFPEPVISTIDQVTDNILGSLEHPHYEGPWDRRGMVVGHVQSGKTANYTALICKAADAGYRVIVVIAGLHNSLRNQTQSRLDRGFVGRDSARLGSRTQDPFVGVGKINQERRPITFTSSIRDFNKASVTVGMSLDDLAEPAIFVIKKHPSSLVNLIDWLRDSNAGRGEHLATLPVLVIDDEADNASINIGRDKVSTINKRIRELLALFKRSCYIAYTATPFANIFIDPDSEDAMFGDDLFPRDFIVSLDPPSNYFGPTRIFLSPESNVLRIITDYDDHLPLSHKKQHPVETLPASLVESLRTFIVARAIRLVRGHHQQHCSMLVNASRFMDVQKQLRNEIHSRVKGISASVRVNGALPEHDAMKDPEMKALRDVWNREYSSLEVEWKDVAAMLNESCAAITVVEVNSSSPGRLDYESQNATGLSVIAVGGFSLSRGLTLEGLMVSYFLRNSKMYDTLMQMGRWFGFRPDYEDLCRVWMPEEAKGWYTHISDSIEELRSEFRSMEASGGTPRDFGLTVRSHPDSLVVTARNKMGTAETVKVSLRYSSRYVETVLLDSSDDSLRHNREVVSTLASNLSEIDEHVSEAEIDDFGFLLRDIPVGIVRSFLATYRNHPGSHRTDFQPLSRYIDERSGQELKTWDVVFTSLRDSHKHKDGLVDHLPGRNINCQRRTTKTDHRPPTTGLWLSSRGRVATRGIEQTGLSDQARQRAEADHRDSLSNPQPTDSKAPPNYPDHVYRKQRKRPLLVVQLVEAMDADGTPLAISGAVVAWGISFPTTQTKEHQEERIVNSQWLLEMNHQASDFTEEEME